MNSAPRWRDFDDVDLVDDVTAAALLKLSRHTLRAWRVSEPVRGPAFSRLGGSVRYTIASLKTFVSRSRVETVDDPTHLAPALRKAG